MRACKPLVRAIRVPGSQRSSVAHCNGNVAGRRGKERDVSLWDNPPLLGADYGLPAPNMAALLFNVRLMGSSLSRSLVATYHVLYGLVVVAAGFAVGRDRAGSLCSVVLFSFSFLFPFFFFLFFFASFESTGSLSRQCNCTRLQLPHDTFPRVSLCSSIFVTEISRTHSLLCNITLHAKK